MLPISVFPSNPYPRMVPLYGLAMFIISRQVEDLERVRGDTLIDRVGVYVTLWWGVFHD